VSDGDLGKFFAIAEDSEFGFSGEDFTSAYDGSLPGTIGKAIIREYFCGFR